MAGAHRIQLRKGQGKWLLRQALYGCVPQERMDRPKMGFGVLIEHWLRGGTTGRETSSRGRLFDPPPIRRVWQEHLSGTRRWYYFLWDVLMFQAWLWENPAKCVNTLRFL